MRRSTVVRWLSGAALIASIGLLSTMPAGSAAPRGEGGQVSGELRKWHTVTVDFAGPVASEADAAPNPFLDYRLQVTFLGPAGQIYAVPGFFDGDGNGGSRGAVWRARFTPDEAGTWIYQASFRQGASVAVELPPEAGTPAAFDGATGAFAVVDGDSDGPGFLKWGRLEYVGKHYLKFRDGPYWLKGGANSPENLLGYVGFDDTPDARHAFAPHASDWRAGDPVFNVAGADAGKGLVGALNYLALQRVNSVYFLPMNIGGDGQDTWPFVGPVARGGSPSNDNRHYDISKLAQWEAAFAHAQRGGIHLHIVLGEAENANKDELGGRQLTLERKLFYRELVARFGHHLALQWNVSEEYDGGGGYNLSTDSIKAFADYIQAVDPYDHPITVHQDSDPDVTWASFLADGRFSVTSFQYPGSVAGYGVEVERWRAKSVGAGRRLVISLDELRSATATNADAQRKEILWPTYLSGGQLEWYIEAEDQSLEDFRRYESLWTHTSHARRFLEEHLPFWEMEPQDDLLTRESSSLGGGQVLAKAGEVYAVYLPSASPSGSLDLSGAPGTFEQRWYSPRTGSFEGALLVVAGGGSLGLGEPPSAPTEDWAVLLKRVDSTQPTTMSTATRADTLTGVPGKPAVTGFSGVGEGQVLAGTVVIEAFVSSPDVTRVQFDLSGPKAVTWTERVTPYYFKGDSGPPNSVPNGWVTTLEPNGEYTLTVIATDSAGQASSRSVNFIIGNK